MGRVAKILDRLQDCNPAIKRIYDERASGCNPQCGEVRAMSSELKKKAEELKKVSEELENHLASHPYESKKNPELEKAEELKKAEEEVEKVSEELENYLASHPYASFYGDSPQLEELRDKAAFAFYQVEKQLPLVPYPENQPEPKPEEPNLSSLLQKYYAHAPPENTLGVLYDIEGGSPMTAEQVARLANLRARGELAIKRATKRSKQE